MVLTLTFQLTNISRRIAIQIADIFEDIGVVQEGMMSIARPLQLIDHARRRAAAWCSEGRIEFEDVRFGYGREAGVLDGFTLTVKPGREASAWSAVRARASRPWSTCCCASSISKAVAS